MIKKREHIGKRLMRNTSLIEILTNDSLKMVVDEEMMCGIKHHMKIYFQMHYMHNLGASKDVPVRLLNSKGQVLFVDFYSRGAHS
jgi:hypothetical protein